jgi:hypothetical protein
MIGLADLPKVLYKYRHFDTANHYEDLLTRNILFFPSPKNFNDPFDCRVYPDYELGTDEEIKKKFYEHLKINRPELSQSELSFLAKKAYKENIDIIKSPKEMMKRMNGIVDSYFGICSMAEENDNLLMWAHYSDCHQGFCIEFDAHELYQIGVNYFNMFDELLLFHKINYERSHPRINPYSSDKNDLINWITTKSIDWNYEKEWRLIYYKFPDMSLDFPDRIIKSIYFGVKCLPERREHCINLLEKRKIIPNIYQAELKHKEFGIVFQKIN